MLWIIITSTKCYGSSYSTQIWCCVG
uniref:Uncharacterized protein n=1 Tax=Arundo donax TaxID=35708 RepID=A0A0A8ZXI0_ARUDO